MMKGPKDIPPLIGQVIEIVENDFIYPYLDGQRNEIAEFSHVEASHGKGKLHRGRLTTESVPELNEFLHLIHDLLEIRSRRETLLNPCRQFEGHPEEIKTRVDQLMGKLLG
jgi:hypothetical protein